MNGFTKLFSTIVSSSVWAEPDHVRLVWITMLALANRDGIVEAAIPGLANLSRVSLEQTQDALLKLEAPDQFSRTTIKEGRRIEKVDGGWLLINHAVYRERMSAEDRRTYKRMKQREYRMAAKSGQPSPQMSTNSTGGQCGHIASASASVHKEEVQEEELPENLRVDTFRAAWTDWKQHRREIRKPLKPTMTKGALRELSAMGPERAITAIRFTISKGWQGIREPEERDRQSGRDSKFTNALGLDV